MQAESQKVGRKREPGELFPGSLFCIPNYISGLHQNYIPFRLHKS